MSIPNHLEREKLEMFIPKYFISNIFKGGLYGVVVARRTCNAKVTSSTLVGGMYTFFLRLESQESMAERIR